MSVTESDAPKTWTVIGHWGNDEIVVECVVEGHYQDQHINRGHWDLGLFAAPGEGRTIEEASAAVRAEYEHHDG